MKKFLNLRENFGQFAMCNPRNLTIPCAPSRDYIDVKEQTAILKRLANYKTDQSRFVPEWVLTGKRVTNSTCFYSQKDRPIDQEETE